MMSLHPFKWLREKLVDYEPQIIADGLKRMRESEEKAPGVFSTIGNIIGSTIRGIGKVFGKLPIAAARTALALPPLALSAAASAVRGVSDTVRYGINYVATVIENNRAKFFDVITGKKREPTAAYA